MRQMYPNYSGYRHDTVAGLHSLEMVRSYSEVRGRDPRNHGAHSVDGPGLRTHFEEVSAWS